jgi:hypothetical protein
MTFKTAHCLLFLALAAVPLVTGAQDPQQAASGAGATPSPFQLQIQALEQARSIAQASADQNKAAIEAIKNLAQASIDDSRETLKNTSLASRNTVDSRLSWRAVLRRSSRS